MVRYWKNIMNGQDPNTIYVSAFIGGHRIVREFPANMLNDIPAVITADLWHLERVTKREEAAQKAAWLASQRKAHPVEDEGEAS